MSSHLATFLNTAAWVLSVLHVASIVTDSLGLTDIFNQTYQTEGFCKETMPTTSLTAFELCFWVDTLGSIFIFFLAFPNRNLKGMKFILMGLPGTILHGLAHLQLHYYEDSSLAKDLTMSQQNVSYELLLGSMAGMTLFWMALTYPVLQHHMQLFTIFLISVLYSVVMVFAMPQKFGFTYIQSVIISTWCLSELIAPNDQIHGVVVSACIMVPSVIVSWCEGLFCDGFLINYGGHAWYDSSLVVGLIAYCSFILLTETQNPKEKRA